MLKHSNLVASVMEGGSFLFLWKTKQMKMRIVTFRFILCCIME